jgi:segregation and condensation protein B
MGRPIMYRSSKEFLMRFGLSDLEELPSLKEFEQLARAALGSDEGIAPIESETPESMNGVDDAASETPEAVAAAEPSSQDRQQAPEPAEAEAGHSDHIKAESAS